MSVEDVNVKVRLDTSQAQASLDALHHEGVRTGQGVSADLRDSVLGRGLRALGVGAAFGTGMQMVQASTQSGIGDIAGETFGVIGQKLNDFFLGTMDDESRASSSAREQMIQTFALADQVRGQGISPQARAFFETIKTVELQKEKGRSMFQADDKFYGPGIGELIGKITDKLAVAIKDGFVYLGNQIPVLNWFV